MYVVMIPHLINAHALHLEHQVINRPPTEVRRVVLRTVVLVHGGAVEPVRVSRTRAAGPAGPLAGGGLRGPNYAPRARPRRVIVNAEETNGFNITRALQ